MVYPIDTLWYTTVMEKRHVPPSRKRYEAKFPLITVRVSKETKDRFQSIRSKQRMSARRLFEELLNNYIQITTPPKQVEQPAPDPREKLYVITNEPYFIGSLEGWEGSLPDKGAITADRNKIEFLERANYEFKEVKETF